MNKKLLKSLFAMVLAMVGILAVSQSASAEVRGDVDGDGTVTASDITILYNYLLNDDSSSLVNGDQDGDGAITAGDVTVVYNILLGIEEPTNDNVYVMGQVNGNTWGAAIGVQMNTTDGKIYTLDATFAGENGGYSYFSFTKKLAEDNNDWDAIADQRFGAESDGFLITAEMLGAPLNLTAENPQAFKIPAGEYTLTVDLENMTLTIAGEIPVEPANVYILGEVNGNSWDPSVGVEMTSEDGKIFTAEITTKESGFSYFGFTTKLAETADDWDGIAGYRFGAQGDGNFLVTEELLNTEIPLTYEYYQALQIAPGSFYLSLDLENMKLTITGEFAPQEPPTSNGWYLIGTPNNWSSSDKSYPFVQDAENENVYSIHVDNVSGDFWFKIAAEGNYELADFWSGDFLSAATDGESALSGNLVAGNQGAFCIPANYNCTYLDITIDVENLTYTITTDGQAPIIDPTAEYDYVYIAGTADGWSGNGGKLASVKDANDYYGFINATGEFKIQKNQGSWATNWGGSNGTLVAGGANIQANGFVYVNANIGNMTYSVTPITSMGVIGDATPGGWETETALTYNAETGAWEGTVTFTTGEFKFRANESWAINFGGALDNLTLEGSNLEVEAGTYNVVLTLVCPGEYTATLTPAN